MDNGEVGVLKGAFLLGQTDGFLQLERAATAPLPAGVKLLLSSEHTTDEDILALLRNEEHTQQGYWRVALGAAAYAKLHDVLLIELTDEQRSLVAALADEGMRSLPNLYKRNSFLVHCAAAMSSLERQVADSSPNPDFGRPLPRCDVKRMAHARTSPSLRFFDDDSGGAFACVNYALVDAQGELAFAEELIAEDMLFIAHSAVNGARSALLSADRIVKTGSLYRASDVASLKERAESIRADLEALVGAWEGMPEASG